MKLFLGGAHWCSQRPNPTYGGGRRCHRKSPPPSPGGSERRERGGQNGSWNMNDATAKPTDRPTDNPRTNINAVVSVFSSELKSIVGVQERTSPSLTANERSTALAKDWVIPSDEMTVASRRLLPHLWRRRRRRDCFIWKRRRRKRRRRRAHCLNGAN